MVEGQIAHLIDGLAAVIVAGLFGIIILEFFESPRGFERMIDPLCRKITKRRDYVKKRDKRKLKY